MNWVILKRLGSVFLFSSAGGILLLKKIVLAFLIFLAARLLVKILRRILFSQHKYPISLPLNRSLIPTISALISVLVYVLATFIILNTVGIVSKTTILALLGSLGLGAGFALKDLISNCIAGIVLLIEQPFKLGDYIHCNGTEGEVYEISLLTTKLENFDGIFIVVPNSNLWGHSIINYTHNKLRRVVVPLFISYADSLELGIKVLEEVIQTQNHFTQDPKPVVVVESLKDGYVEIQLRAWTINKMYWDVYYDTLIKVKNHALLRGLSLPVSQRDLHVSIAPSQTNTLQK